MICVRLFNLISTLGENSCILCTIYLSLLYAVTLHSICIHVDDIYRHIRFMPLSWLQHAIRRKSQQRNNVAKFLWNLSDRCIWSCFSSYYCWRESPTEILRPPCASRRENIKFHASDSSISRSSYDPTREWQFPRCHRNLLLIEFNLGRVQYVSKTFR